MIWKRHIKSLLGENNIDVLNNIFMPFKYKWNSAIRRLGKISPSGADKINVKTIKFVHSNHQVFFGYYDVTPFSRDDDFLLAIHAPPENLSPKTETKVGVGYYELNKNDSPFIEIGKTTTWCWQQGCRLQWYPEYGSKEVLYNRLVDNRYGCVVQNIQSKKITNSYRKPLYAVSKDGNWGLSLNFSRLHRLRPGYGYINFPDKTEGQLAPKNDGIWRIDMKTGKEDFLFSVAEITQLKPLESMAGAEHYFNHILFNPGGARFMFFHVWLKEGKRFTRLITCDIDGEDKYALINEGHVSHYTWKSNSELLAYSTHKDTGMNYHLYEDKSTNRRIIGKEVLSLDGHPSYLPDGSLLLTDTYPDKYGERQLLIYQLKTEKLHSLGSFYNPYKYRGEVRCDLHPRWSHHGKQISFDSTHEGKRAMYLIKTNSFS